MNQIYGLYAAQSAGAAPPLSAEAVQKYFADLQTLAAAYKGEAAPQSGAISDKNAGLLGIDVASKNATTVTLEAIDKLLASPNDKLQAIGVGLAQRLAETFFHFERPSASPSPISERVYDLAQLAAKHPEYFNATSPLMTLPQGRGISTGAEPLRARSSFGSIRAEAIFAALEQARDTDAVTFRRQVDTELAARGVDPQHPDRNLEAPQ